MGGCYDTRVAPGSGVCREARGGACVGYAEETTRSGQTAETCTVGTETGQCADTTGNCETSACNVQIGDSLYCSQCSNGGSETSSPAPTNGVCTTDNNECSVKADGRCTTCAHESFMFQGGCYRADQTPGQSMCRTAADGVCTVVADGSKYFLPPTGEADNLHQSVIPCGDDSVVTVKNNKQYKGVANCLTCTAPGSGGADAPTAATCTKCADGYFGAACTACDEQCATCEGTNSDSKCKSCKVGYFLGATNNAAGKCIQCDNLEDPSWKGVANCAKCTSSKTSGTPATCTECAEGYYLRIAADGTTTSCVADCDEGFFPTTVNNIKKCVSCSETSNGGIENCSTCTPIESPTTTVLVKCSACDNSKKVSPGGSSCVTACPENSTASEGACICSSGFTPSGDSCAASSHQPQHRYHSRISVAVIAACSVLLIGQLSL
ncbi:Variant-specific surface protein [Giardia duodenalis]|uniref:Variant-specific surface protein n=1 Tax=Giardia intestinalis TaxID=5741 RepID=V6TYJ7_GIAIN|nr:Variant-specific surface protein [Giardia intestinalis]